MNQNPAFQDFLVSQTPHVDIWVFMVNLALNTIVVAVIMAAYVRWGRSLSNRAAFARNLVLVSMTTMLIITIVKSSLALSLGLVGALSIIRFRTPIKEPEELAFLFLAISTGLGFGAGQRLPVIVGVAGVLAVLYVMSRRGARERPQAIHLTLSLARRAPGMLERAVEVLTKHAESVHLHRHDEQAESFTSDFFVSFREFDDLNQARKELRELDDDIVVSFLDTRLQA